MKRILNSILGAVLVCGWAGAAGAATTSYNTDLSLNDAGSTTNVFMEGAEVMRKDNGGAFYFGDVAGANFPFVIRANGGDRMKVEATNATLYTSLLLDRPGSMSQFFMESHEVMRVFRDNSLIIGDIGGVGLGVVFRTNGGDRLTISPTGAASFSNTVTAAGNITSSAEMTCDVINILGGSDLSEMFDVAGGGAVEPGCVVCIDPKDPGKLLLSTTAYDRTVAGIVSGAGDVKPGMRMSQRGTAADGLHPVALTGRVYVKADASAGAIVPGDLLTTAERPGHAMKVLDHSRAQGAILGKAMSSLDAGQGLVMVLVSLQ